MMFSHQMKLTLLLEEEKNPALVYFVRGKWNSVPFFVISEFCANYSCEGRPALRRVLWSKVTKATTCFRRSRGIPPLPNCGRPRKY